MSWEFLYSVRREFQGDSNWGEMFIKAPDNKNWQWLCYTYELPWRAGPEGKSISNRSRVEMGVYELVVRTDGPKRPAGKGWRLELMNTGHRGQIQIHRAFSDLSIQGCILPVHFNTLSGSAIRKGDMIIQNKSIEIMLKIEVQLGNLQKFNKTNGRPSLTIAETLPAAHITNRSHAHA